MHAPGQPGIAPTWTTSAKDMVGTALGPARVWFTTSFGILNEIYYPRADIPQTRDLGIIVADGNGFWVEVKRLESYRVCVPGPGIPVVEIVHTHPRFELRLRVAPDALRDVMLIELALSGDPGLRPYVLLAPHLGGTGHDNTACTAIYNGHAVLWAEQGPFGLALAAVDMRQHDALGRSSAGYVGVSDGWQDFARNGAMSWTYDEAGPGNVALTGELPRQAVLALGFGSSKESAATLALASLAQPFEAAWQHQVECWQAWHADRTRNCAFPPDLDPDLVTIFQTSAMVLRAHQDKTYPGAMVASLSVPWGTTKDDLGGYHLVWPRDLVESAGGLLSLGAIDEARNILRYLIATQQADGHWYQNQWLGGKPYWSGVQLDEAGFAVLLAAALIERDALDDIVVDDMVQRALGFIVRSGPTTQQDRWEEDAGVNLFTLAVCIAALVCGADFLQEPARGFVLDLADYWNSRIEHWTVVHNTRLARELGVESYYVRMAPAQVLEGRAALSEVLPIKNRARDLDLPAEEQVGGDFLQLVRFGLRRADDPVIRASVKVTDSLLKVDTPSGPAWHRYNGDGYGEHADGLGFDGTGHGRAWPLLTGERGHYALAAGEDARPYLRAMAAMSGKCGLIPEQVWDSAPIPEHNLHPGRPTGSAMPLVWAHAEFIKLATSMVLGRPFDRPEAVWKRYQGRRPDTPWAYWSLHVRLGRLPCGKRLRIVLPQPALIHWGTDGWRNAADLLTHDAGLGLYLAELPTDTLRPGQRIDFTFRWLDDGRWHGQDYSVDVRPRTGSDQDGR
ncbi:MAG: glycoside hydrolase family 15 protein [Gammaproteobacteria bacterium]|nr:glycoside hydrolase family 15 protein [Gammaproteobacteria bacterium]